MRKVPQTMGCRYCPKDQRCELQETVELIGLEKIDAAPSGADKEVVRSPFFDRDPNLCILCGRCVRACEERGWGVISFIFRGFDAGIGTAFEKPLEKSAAGSAGLAWTSAPPEPWWNGRQMGRMRREDGCDHLSLLQLQLPDRPGDVQWKDPPSQAGGEQAVRARSIRPGIRRQRQNP